MGHFYPLKKPERTLCGAYAPPLPDAETHHKPSERGRSTAYLSLGLMSILHEPRSPTRWMAKNLHKYIPSPDPKIIYSVMSAFPPKVTAHLSDLRPLAERGGNCRMRRGKNAQHNYVHSDEFLATIRIVEPWVPFRLGGGFPTLLGITGRISQAESISFPKYIHNFCTIC